MTASEEIRKRRPRTLRDITGQRFGKLVVIRRDGYQSEQRAWLCQCDCGNTTRSKSYVLTAGIKLSCGCRIAEMVSKSSRTHGMTGNHSPTREYLTWSAMKNRCYNSNHPAYKNYGGRGISVCANWKDSFEAFFKDMGPKPKGLSIERKNNNGNYEPGNCVWATRQEQAKNRRPRRRQ